jgi:hypothetical protein
MPLPNRVRNRRTRAAMALQLMVQLVRVHKALYRPVRGMASVVRLSLESVSTTDAIIIGHAILPGIR